jgi:DNA-binding transcriptional regulator YiaG
MTNHPNRSRARWPSANPTPAEIASARSAAGLTQEVAARLVHSAAVTWRQWESGLRRMHPAMWELFKIKSSD